MRYRPGSRITILRMMSCVAVVGCVSGLILREWEQLDLLMSILIPSLVFAGPSLIAVHLAIEANRREDSLRQTHERSSSCTPTRNGRSINDP